MKVELAYVCQLMCTRSLLEHLWTSHNHFPFAIRSQFSLLNEFQDTWSCEKKNGVQGRGTANSKAPRKT